MFTQWYLPIHIGMLYFAENKISPDKQVASTSTEPELKRKRTDADICSVCPLQIFLLFVYNRHILNTLWEREI